MVGARKRDLSPSTSSHCPPAYPPECVDFTLRTMKNGGRERAGLNVLSTNRLVDTKCTRSNGLS